MRPLSLLVLAAVLVAGCGETDVDFDVDADVSAAATGLASSMVLDVEESVLAAAVDGSGSPVLVTSQMNSSGWPVLKRDGITATAVELIGVSGVQSIWAMTVAPDDSVVMVADAPYESEIVRVDPAGVVDRQVLQLQRAADANSYRARHPMRTYASFTADATTAVVLTVPMQPLFPASDPSPESTGQVELHRVDTATGKVSAHSITQLPGPGPFVVLGVAVSPGGDLISVAVAHGPEGALTKSLAETNTLDAAVLRFDAAVQPIDQVHLTEQAGFAGGQPLAIDSSGTTYTVISRLDDDPERHSGNVMLSIARDSGRPEVVNDLEDVSEAMDLEVAPDGSFAYLPGWSTDHDLGVTVVDLADGSITAQLDLCDGGVLTRAALSPDASSLLVSGQCGSEEQAAAPAHRESVLVLR